MGNWARGIQAGLATRYFLRLAMVVFIVIFVFVNAYPFCSVFLENPGTGGYLAISLSCVRAESGKCMVSRAHTEQSGVFLCRYLCVYHQREILTSIKKVKTQANWPVNSLPLFMHI